VERERSAALLVRVWLEDGADGFRARVTAVGAARGAAGEDPTVAVAATPSDLLDAMREWLDSFVRGVA
jgi:hypothetical protein